ncbi:MAG: DUF2280 domain-containing protein [Marinomonas sp.]
MAGLTGEQKEEIVRMHACFASSSAIRQRFQFEYGLALTHKQVGRYDPTRAYFAGGDKWREIFQAQRRTYLNDLSEVPIANQAYRLNILQQGVDEAIRTSNWTLVAKLLEQAAKEVGGVLTNNSKIRVEESKPAVRHKSPEEREAAMADIIERARLAMQDSSANTPH